MEQALVEAPEAEASSSANGPQTLHSLQLPDYRAVRNQSEMEEYTDCLKIEAADTASAIYPGRAIELQQRSEGSALTQQPTLLDYQFSVQTQQERLFNDPRRHKLFAEYNEIKLQNPDSHLARLGELAQYVFENGRPARVWTAGGEGSALVGLDPSKPSIHGKCDCRYDDADILLLTESEHAAWSRANNPPKLVVIRDAKFSRRRPAKTTETWLREQERAARSQKIWVDVQRLDRKCDDAAAEKTPLQDAIRQWRIGQDKDAISLETPPMNLLNISDITTGHWPEGLAKDYQLLFDAIAQCDGMIYHSLDERLAQLPEQDREIGKSTLMMFSHSDIQKCTQFRILAQRGACSSWHIDNVGVYTFIILEGNLDNPAERAEDVVKYWPVYPTHHMSSKEQAAARMGFAKEGINWRPIPDGKIPVIALTRGDMLIQPPGTIHAPITLTNCFFLGGMAWRKSTLPQTLNVWHYLMKNEICTNEPLPRQSQAILDYIKVAVHDEPKDFGYQGSELGEFDKMCDEISGRVSRCGCSKACSLSTKCSCLMQGLKCGIRCHKGDMLHHTTCTTANIFSPSSLAEKKKPSKRSHLKDGEDSDCTLNDTPPARTGRKRRVLEALKEKAPHNASLPNERLENPAVTNSVDLKRPEICPKSSTGATCEYVSGRGGAWTCKDCHFWIPGEAGRLPRSRTSVTSVLPGSATHLSPSILEKVSHDKKCDYCQSSIKSENKQMGLNGLRNLCGSCDSKLAKGRRELGSNDITETKTSMQNNENVAMPEQVNGDKMLDKCEHCNVATQGPREVSTESILLCPTCEKKCEPKVPEGSPMAIMNNSDHAMSANEAISAMANESPFKPGDYETRRPSKGLKRMCLQCHTCVVSERWYRYEGGYRCPKCYQKDKRKCQKDTKNGLPTPSTNRNKATKPTGIKLRLGPKPPKNAAENDGDRANNYSSQVEPFAQLQSDVHESSFEAPTGLPQIDSVMDVCNADWTTTTELFIAAKPQGLAPQDLSLTSLPNQVGAQITAGFQTIQPHVASPPPAEYEVQNDPGSMIPSLESQTYPTSGPEPDDVCPINPSSHCPNPSAFAQQPLTNGSSTTRSPTELSDLHYSSSSLSDLGDQFSDYDLEDMDLLKP